MIKKIFGTKDNPSWYVIFGGFFLLSFIATTSFFIIIHSSFGRVSMERLGLVDTSEGFYGFPSMQPYVSELQPLTLAEYGSILGWPTMLLGVISLVYVLLRGLGIISDVED